MPRYPHVIKARPRDAFGDSVWCFILVAIALGMLPVVLLMDSDLWTRVSMAALAVGCGVGAGWVGVNIVTFQTIFEADAVTVRNAFGAWRFERASMIGWRFSGEQAKLTLIELYTATSKRPFIIAILKERDDVVAAWFEGARDLEVEDTNKALDAVEADESFGHTKDARIASVDAENRVLGFAYVGFLVFAGWIAIIAEPYAYAIAAGIAVPILLVIVTFVRRDRWKLDRDDHDLRPTTGALIALCVAALWLRAFTDWRLINWGHATLLALAAGAAITVIVALIFRERFRSRLLLWFGVAALYSYGAIVPLNMWLDRERPEVHRASVARVDEQSYELNTLPPLPPEVGNDGTPEFLQRLEAAGEACLPVYRGAFGISSYDVVLCDQA